MRKRQPVPADALPRLWLLSDARNDAVLERALERLPRSSALVLRHYHLPPDERQARLRRLARIARARGHIVVLAGTASQAMASGALGAYGNAARLARGPGMLRLVTAHNLREIGRAHRARADAILLSPVFPTRSHPGQPALGPVRFRLLAARAMVPVIALGGMTRRSAARLRWRRWAAIDGLS